MEAAVTWTSKPPENFQWEPKPHITQMHTRSGYLIAEVQSAFEKAVLAANVDDATFWFQQLIDIAPSFVTTGWALLFHLTLCSAAHLFDWMSAEYHKYKMCRPTTADGHVDESELDPRCRAIVVNAAQVLADAKPKSRIVDSAVRTFFLPYPGSITDRPYDTQSRVHLRPLKNSNDVLLSIANTSYVDDFKEGFIPHYTLFELQPNDPPYLGRWCNALYQSLLSVRRPEDRAVARDAVLYYAGLIYQCSEPCHKRQRKKDSVQIIWNILQKHCDHVEKFRKMSDEFSSSSQKRERVFVVAAILETCNVLAGLSTLPSVSRPFLVQSGDAIAWVTRGSAVLLPVPECALDFTTKEGQRRGAKCTDFVRTTTELLGGSGGGDDPYYEYALLYEGARDAENFKDTKRVLASRIAYFTASAHGPSVRRPLYHYRGAGPLPWRGQFLPYTSGPGNGGGGAGSHVHGDDDGDNDDDNGGGAEDEFAHPFNCFSNLIATPQGVFVARYTRGDESELVVLIPCLNSRQAFNQCLADELKPLFGVPRLGTHCLLVDHSVVKLNKSLPWSADNFKIEPGPMYVACFRASTFGITDPSHISLVFEQGTLSTLDKARSTEMELIRIQLLNIMAFYFCLGITNPQVTSKMILRPRDGGPPLSPGDPIQARIHAIVVPFHETVVFSNITFPTLVKTLKVALARFLFIDNQRHFMQRYFDLAQFLNFEAIETILVRFGAPLEWSGVIRDNLRDLRASWLTWSQHSEATKFQKKGAPSGVVTIEMTPFTLAAPKTIPPAKTAIKKDVTTARPAKEPTKTPPAKEPTKTPPAKEPTKRPPASDISAPPAKRKKLPPP